MLQKTLPPLLSGLLFGAGLALSGMTDPQRVRGFLDVAGTWDPTLAFVMGGAVLVMALVWPVQKIMSKPVWAETFSLPDRTDLDARLMAGALIFGIGWGIAGLCPGPAMALLALDPFHIWPFILAMVVGMGVQKILLERR